MVGEPVHVYIYTIYVYVQNIFTQHTYEEVQIFNLFQLSKPVVQHVFQEYLCDCLAAFICDLTSIAMFGKE